MMKMRYVILWLILWLAVFSNKKIWKGLTNGNADRVISIIITKHIIVCYDTRKIYEFSALVSTIITFNLIDLSDAWDCVFTMAFLYKYGKIISRIYFPQIFGE